jgi:hypothetical protein
MEYNRSGYAVMKTAIFILSFRLQRKRKILNDEGNYYCNKVTGEIIYLGNEESRIASNF